MSDPIVPGLATITSLSYANTAIALQLDFAPSKRVTAGLFQRSVSGTPLVTGTNSGTGVVVFYNGTLNPGVVYYVALTFDPVNGPWGLPVALVWQQPALTSAFVGPSLVAVSWSIPATTTITAVRASLYDATANTRVVIGVFSGNGAQLVPPLPLNPAHNYTISLVGVAGIASGPQVTSGSLSFASPEIGATAYAFDNRDGYGVTVTLQAPMPESTAAMVRLRRDGVVVQSQIAVNSPVTLGLQQPLDPRARWEVDAYYLTGVIAGPPGFGLALEVPPVPAIASLFYAAGSIIVTLAAAARPVATVALFQGTPSAKAWIASTTTSGSGANLSVDPAVLQPGFVYNIALTLDPNASPVIWGTPAPLVWQQPTLAALVIGEQSVDVEWTLPATTTINAVSASIYDSTRFVTVATATSSGSGTRLETAVALDPTHTYVLELIGRNGISSSAKVQSAPLILSPPELASIVYAYDGLTQTYSVTATPGESPGAGRIVIGRLLRQNQPVIEQTEESGTVTFRLRGPLDPDSSWQVALLLRSGLLLGPPGIPRAIPLVSPELTLALYDGSNFHVAWRGAAGANAVVLREDDQVVVGQTAVTNGFSAIVQPTSAIDETKRYSVSLAPLNEMARGLAGPKTMLIVAKPTLASVASDGGQVAVSLAQVDSNAQATELLLSSASGSILTVPAGLSGGYATLPHVAITGVQVAARAAAGGVVGPASKTTAVITAVPSITNVSINGTAVTGTVTAPAEVTLGSPVLSVTLYADGIPIGAPVHANSDGRFSIPTTGTQGVTLTLTASLTGLASEVTVTTPQSAPVPVLTSAPVVTGASLIQINATSWQIAADWTAPAGSLIGSYRVTLLQERMILQTWTVAATSLSEATPAFDTQKALSVTVTPLGNWGSGPASNVMTLLPSAMGSVTARVDGSLVTADWTINTSAGTPTHFRLRLLQSVPGVGWVTVARSQTVGGTTASLSLPLTVLNATTTFGVSIDAAVGNSWVSTTTVGTLLTTAPLLTSAIAASNSTMAIAWEWAGTTPAIVDGYLPVVLWNGDETALPKLPATPRHATISVPTSIPGGASLALRAVAGDVTGPVGQDIPMLLQAPNDLAVAYDGSTIEASWHAPDDPRVNAYSVTFMASGETPVVTTVTDTTWRKAFTPTTGQTASVNVAALAGVGAGPLTMAVDAILDAPQIIGAVSDGATLTLTWAAAVSAAAKWTLISIFSGGKLSRQVAAGGTATTLLLHDGPFAVGLQGQGDTTLGPLSALIAPITAAPAIDSALFSIAERSLTLAWSAIPQAGGYQVAFRHATGIIKKRATTNTLVIPASELPASGVYSVVVQAVGNLANLAIVGPWSAAVPLILLAPSAVDVAYDGRKAMVSWSAVTAPEVVGYIVTLLDGTASVSSMTSSNTSLQIAAPYSSAKNYRIVVQALTSVGGALPSLAISVFGAGWYPSTSASEAASIKPFTTAAMTASDIIVYLPNIFTTYVSSGLPSNPPFVLATTNRQPFVYTLTMPASSIVWSFDGNTPRQNVITAYTALLTALMSLNVTPLGWRIVQDAIARAMPQTFGETLYYAYAFDPAGGSIDLKPGMVLRADFESYQFLGREQGSSQYLNGFVASNSVDYEIGSYVSGSDWLTGFDAFLSSITLQGTAVPAPSNDGSNYSGGGGIVDLYYGDFRLPFLRLVYPPNLLASGESDARPAFNVAVLAAVDYPTLATATTNLRNGRPLGRGAFATYLRGRTTLSPCICVWLNDRPARVAVGTTVGNVLEQMGARPPIFPPLHEAGTPGIALSGLTLVRASGYAITDPDTGINGYAIGAGVPIKLDWAGGMAYSALSDWLALPLLAGDRLHVAVRT